MGRLGLPEVNPALFAEALLPGAAANPLPSRQAGCWPAASCHTWHPGLGIYGAYIAWAPSQLKTGLTHHFPQSGPCAGPSQDPSLPDSTQPMSGWPWAQQEV